MNSAVRIVVISILTYKQGLHLAGALKYYWSWLNIDKGKISGADLLKPIILYYPLYDKLQTTVHSEVLNVA